MKTQLLQEARAMQERLTAWRRTIHACPETGFDLNETKAYVKHELTQMGVEPQECGRSGVTAVIGDPTKGPVFLLRGDMDALPIREESGEAFASVNGNMHACGHDLHTAMLLGAAQLLKNHEQELKGCVKLMFQPAEEIFQGAADMLAHGVLENPAPEAGMMIHVLSGMPNTGIDPLTAAAHILINLQEIHARELAMDEAAVLTVGYLQGGKAANAIPDTAVLGGTIRTMDEETRTYVKRRLTEIAQDTAKVFRAEATTEFSNECPALVNDDHMVSCAARYARDLLGASAVLTAEQMNTGRGNKLSASEDFAYVAQQLPIVMVALAAGEPVKGYVHPAHHPMVTFDESALPVGCAAYAGVAMRYLEDHGGNKE